MVRVAHGEQVLHLVRLSETGQVTTPAQVLRLRIQIPDQVPIPYVEIIRLLVYELVVQALRLTWLCAIGARR